MHALHRTSRWYRQPEPWLLLLAPAVAVVAGIFTWWIAATSDHALVVDDYYRQGKAINQTLARDAEAARLGLSAILSVDGHLHEARLDLGGLSGRQPPPETLRLRLVHATRAELDQTLTMHATGDGRYRAAFAPPTGSRWTVHIEEPQGHWRLVRSTTSFVQPLRFEAESRRE